MSDKKEFDYDIEIKIPITLRLWNKDGDEVTHNMDLMLGSEVIEDDTLNMIFRDIDKYINEHIMRNR